MARQRLSEGFLQKLLLEEAPKRKIYYDPGFRGFGVRTTEGGSVSFVLRYLTSEGRERLYTIGRYPEFSLDQAEAEYHELNAKLKKKEDPLAQKKHEELTIIHAGHTFKELADDYMNRKARNFRPRTQREIKQLLRHVLRPRFDALPLAAIGRKELVALHNDYAATPYQANRCRGLLSCMFAWAMSDCYDMIPDPTTGEKSAKYWMEANPVFGSPRYQEDKRTMSFPKAHQDALREAIAKYPGRDTANALEVLMRTGCRRGELLAATWEQFDLERGYWNRPASVTKQKKRARLKLSPRTIELLCEMYKEKSDSPFLFPGKIPGQHRVTLERAWLQISRMAGLLRKSPRTGKLVPAYRIHDLRHNLASLLVSDGETLPIIGRMLGHSTVAMTERYADVHDVAMEKAALRSDELIDG